MMSDGKERRPKTVLQGLRKTTKKSIEISSFPAENMTQNLWNTQQASLYIMNTFIL
jgi:hypothetical protein